MDGWMTVEGKAEEIVFWMCGSSRRQMVFCLGRLALEDYGVI